MYVNDGFVSRYGDDDGDAAKTCRPGGGDADPAAVAAHRGGPCGIDDDRRGGHDHDRRRSGPFRLRRRRSRRRSSSSSTPRSTASLSATGVEVAHRHGAGDEDGVARALRAGLRLASGSGVMGALVMVAVPASIHRPAARGVGDPWPLLVRDVRPPGPRRLPDGDRASAERDGPAVDGGGLRLRGRDPERAVQLPADLGRGRLGRARPCRRGHRECHRGERGVRPRARRLRAVGAARAAGAGAGAHAGARPGRAAACHRLHGGGRGLRGRGDDAGPVRGGGAGREPDRAGSGKRALHAAPWHVGGHGDPGRAGHRRWPKRHLLRPVAAAAMGLCPLDGAGDCRGSCFSAAWWRRRCRRTRRSWRWPQRCS